mgnify:CR=1 FL=1
MRIFKNFRIFLNIHKAYKAVMLVLTVVLLFVQLALTNPNGRSVLTFIDKYEGGLSLDSNVSQLGEIKLSLVGAEPSAHIEILQNGQPIAYFYDTQITITVSDNSVIEIDGRRVKESFSVEITEMTPNIQIENAATVAEVNSNIAPIGRVLIKN